MTSDNLNKKYSLPVFRKTYDHFYGKVFRVISVYVKNEHDIEDIIQNVFLHLWKTKRDTFERELEDAILIKACRQEINKWYKKTRKMVFIEELTEVKDDKLADNLITRKETVETLDKIVKMLDTDLPKKNATLFRMKVLEGKTYRQISDELSISEKTLSKHFKESVSLLRSRLASFFL